MPFNPDEYLKKAAADKTSGGGFDPDAYLSKAKGGKEGAGQAALESYGNTATLGYLPHLQAAASQVTPNPSSGVDAELESKGFSVSQPKEKGYVQARDENIAREAQQKKDFPWATRAGSAAGLVAGGLMIPGGATLARGASLGAKAWQGAKTGGAIGALMNPGDVEGDVSFMPGERVKNAFAGGTLGGLAPPVVAGGKWLVSSGAPAVARKAAEKAFQALGRSTPNAMKQAVESGKNIEIGRELLDEGAVPWLGTTGRIGTRVNQLKEKAGEQIGDLVAGAGNAKVVDAKKLGIQILDSPELAMMRKTPGMESAVNTIERQVETLARNKKMDVAEAQKLRQAIDESLYKNSRGQEFTGAKEGLHLQRSGLRDAMNEGINTLNPGTAKDRLLSANRKYGNLSQASEILEKQGAKNQSGDILSFKDLVTGSLGPTTVSKIALAALSKAGRAVGSAVQARGYDAIANSLARSAPVVEIAQNNPGLVSRLAAAIGQEVTGGKQDYSMEKDPILSDPQILMLFKKDEKLLNSVEDPQRRALIRDALKRLPAGR